MVLAPISAVRSEDRRIARRPAPSPTLVHHELVGVPSAERRCPCGIRAGWSSAVRISCGARDAEREPDIGSARASPGHMLTRPRSGASDHRSLRSIAQRASAAWPRASLVGLDVLAVGSTPRSYPRTLAPGRLEARRSRTHLASRFVENWKPEEILSRPARAARGVRTDRPRLGAQSTPLPTVEIATGGAPFPSSGTAMHSLRASESPP